MRLIKKRSAVSGAPTDSDSTSHNPSLISLPSSPPPTPPQPQQPSASTPSISAPSTTRPPSRPSSPKKLLSDENKERDKSGENRYPPSSFFQGHGRVFGRMRSIKGKKRATKREDGTMSEGEGGDLDVGRESLGLSAQQVQDQAGPSRPVVTSPPATAPAPVPAPAPKTTPPRPLPTPPKPTQTMPVPPVTNPSPRRPLPHPPLSPSTGARFEGRSRKSGAMGKARSQGVLRLSTTPGVPSVLVVHTPASSNTAPVAVGLPAPALGLGDTLVPPRPPFASTPSSSSALSTARGESAFPLIPTPTPRADDGQPHSRSVRNEPGAPKKLTKRRPVSMVGDGYGYNLVESPVDLADSASGVGAGERIEMAREMAMERAEKQRGHGHARSASTGSSATRLAHGTSFVLVNSTLGGDGAPSPPSPQPQPSLQISICSHLLPPSQGPPAPLALPLPHPPHHSRHPAPPHHPQRQEQQTDMLWSLNRNPSTSTTTVSTSSAAGPSTDESALVSTPAECPAPSSLAAAASGRGHLDNLWAGRKEEGRAVVSRASTASFREGDDGSVVGGEGMRILSDGLAKHALQSQGVGALGLRDPALAPVGDEAGEEMEREQNQERVGKSEQERSKAGSTKSGHKHSPTESTVHGSPSTGRTHRKREGSPTLSAERSVKTITPMASLGDGQAAGTMNVKQPGVAVAGGVEGNERIGSDVEDIIEACSSPLPGSAGPLSHAYPRPRVPTNTARPPLDRLRSTSLASTSLGTNSVYSVGEVGTATVGVMMTALAVNLDIGAVGRGGVFAGEDQREAEGATFPAEGIFDPLVQTSADLRAAFDIERDPAWRVARQSAEDSASAAAEAKRARQRQRQYITRAPPIPPHLSPTQGYRPLPNHSTGTGTGSQSPSSPNMFEYTPNPLSAGAGAAPPRAPRAPRAPAAAPAPGTRTARAQSQPPRRQTTSPAPAEESAILAPVPVWPTKRPAMMDRDGSLGKIFRKISFGRGSGKKKKVRREGESPDGVGSGERGEEMASPMAGDFGPGSGSGAGGRPGLPRSGSAGSPLKQRMGLFTASPESFTPPSRGGSLPSPGPPAPESSGGKAASKEQEVPTPSRLVKKRSQKDIHRVPKPQPHRSPDSTQHIPSVTPMGLMITNPDPKSAPGTPGETLESAAAGQGQAMVVSTTIATSSRTTTGAGGTVSSTSTTLVASAGTGSLSATTTSTSSGFRTILGPYTPPELNPLPSYFSTPPRPYSPSAPASPRLRPRTMLQDAASHEARRQVRHTLVLIKDDAEFKNMLEEFARMEDDPRLIAAGGGGFAMRYEGEGREGEGKVVVRTKSMEMLEADAKRKRMQAWFSTREIVLGEQKVAKQLKRALVVAQVAATKPKEFMPISSPTTPPAPHSAPPSGVSALDLPPSLGSRGHKRTGSNGFLRSRRPSLSEKRSSDSPLPTPTSSSSSVPPVPALPTPRPTPSPQPSQDNPSPAPALAPTPTAASSPILTLLTHLPALIDIFETLSSAFSHDPSPYGVAEAFVEMEDKLTKELALWASEVGPMMVSSTMEGLNRILDEDRRKRGKKGAGEGDEVDGSMGRLAFSDIILSPIQRAARYTMHFTQLSAHLDPGSRTYQKVVLAVEASQRLAQQCDNAQEMDQELLRMPGKKKQRPASVGYGVGGGSGGLWS